jgi:hypothetical protein
LAVGLQEEHIGSEGIGLQKSGYCFTNKYKYEEAKRIYKNKRKEHSKVIIFSILSFSYSNHFQSVFYA